MEMTFCVGCECRGELAVLASFFAGMNDWFFVTVDLDEGKGEFEDGKNSTP